MTRKIFIIAICLMAQMFAASFAAEITINVAGKATQVETTLFNIKQNETGVAILPAGDLLGVSGEPQIPWKAMRVLLPPNAQMESLSCRMISVEYKTLEDFWDVAPVPPMLTRDEQDREVEVWSENKTIVNGRDTAIYSANALWPAKAVRVTSTGQLHDWKLADLAVPLVRFNPVTGKLQQLVPVSRCAAVQFPFSYVSFLVCFLFR